MLATVAVALGVASAQAARSADGKARTGKVSEVTVSPNWSGYALSSDPEEPITYTSSTGTWKEPAVTCSPTDADAPGSAIWVGLGGYDLSHPTGTLEQLGVNANCDTSGKPIYFAWFEIVPFPAYTINAKVAPGDTVTVSLKIIHPYVEFQVQNLTRHWTFKRKISWAGPDTASAEWIVEAPLGCLNGRCRQRPLADFGTVRITNIGATGGSAKGTLSRSTWTPIPIRLVPTIGTSVLAGPGEAGRKILPSPGAVPGTLTADGSEFAVSWLPVANRG